MNRWKNWALTHTQSKASDYLILTLMLAFMVMLLAGCSGTPTPTTRSEYPTTQQVQADLDAAGVTLNVSLNEFEEMSKDTCKGIGDGSDTYRAAYLHALADKAGSGQVREIITISIRNYCSQYLDQWLRVSN